MCRSSIYKCFLVFSIIFALINSDVPFCSLAEARGGGEPGSIFEDPDWDLVWPVGIMGATIVGMLMIPQPLEPQPIDLADSIALQAMITNSVPCRVKTWAWYSPRPSKYLYGQVADFNPKTLSLRTTNGTFGIERRSIEALQPLSPLASRAKAGRTRLGLFFAGLGVAYLVLSWQADTPLTTLSDEAKEPDILGAALIMGAGFSLALRQREPEREIQYLIDLPAHSSTGPQVKPGKIGIQIQNQIVAGVIVSGPADMAGVKVGDKILSANGIALNGDSSHDVALIIGDPGTAVTLMILRDGQELEVSVIRGQP